MAIKKQSKKTTQNKFNSTPALKQMLIFIVAFAVIGSGYMAFRIYAKPQHSDAEVDPEAHSLRRELTKEEAAIETSIANTDDISAPERRDAEEGISLGVLRKRILLHATKDLGVNESQNQGMINNQYLKEGCSGNKGDPWCAAFVSWIYQNSYEPYKIHDPPKTCSVSTLLSDKDAKKLTSKDEVQRGDILIAKHGDVSHTGIFSRIDNNEIVSVDGNWGDAVAWHRADWNEYWDAYIPLESFDITNPNK